MLTKELAIAEYDFSSGRIVPDRLTQKTHEHYLRYAERMLNVYRRGPGRTRRELHAAVRDVFAREEDCPARRIDAFCKLLDDASDYDRDRWGKAAELRRTVFHLASSRHPLVEKADRLFESDEAAVKADIARQLGRSWDEIQRELFEDVIKFHRLKKFDGYENGAALLARYNVAQVQAALFSAETMTVWAEQDFKTILRYAKLARLMHTISRAGNAEYVFRFDGPASVLRETRRYGASMARFLPALIACRQWRMHATVRVGRRGWTLALDLNSDDGLHSHLPPPGEFDSQVEETFAKRWGDGPRDGWRLERETEVLCRGQKVFVPDFVFRHEDGRSALLEIVGFWTPEYLQSKLETLAVFGDESILLAVWEQSSKQLTNLPGGSITYKTALRVGDVLERLSESSPVDPNECSNRKTNCDG